MSSIDLTPTQKEQLVKILKEITSLCDLEAIAIVSKEGESLAFFAGKRADPDLLSAVSAAVLNTGEMVTHRMDHGNLSEMMIRGDKGFTILSNAGDYILIGANRDISAAGITMRVFRQHTDKIQEILEARYLNP